MIREDYAVCSFFFSEFGRLEGSVECAEGCLGGSCGSGPRETGCGFLGRCRDIGTI